MEKIVLATSNPGKLKEISHKLGELDFEFHIQAEYAVEPAQETGLTFIENAILKARHAARLTGLPAIADDSGLVVDSLGGEPGVFSSRYAGEKAPDSDNMEKLLQCLQAEKNLSREAHFYCVMVYLKNAEDPMPFISEGKWHGSILKKPRGVKGFGYDPIFHVPTHQCSAAELELAEKNRISHRGQALNALILELKRRHFS